MNRPAPHEIYRHFKGNLYQIQCIAKDSENGSEMVVYQALYGDYLFYVRPLEMFLSKVDKIKYPDAKQEYRFEKVNVGQDKVQTPAEQVKTVETVIKEPDIIKEPSVIREPSVISETLIEEEQSVDPDVLDFLDADNYERRLEILGKIKYKITDDMIDIMSTVLDIDVPQGDVAKRYEDFKEALMTRRHYECSRFRRM